MHCQRSSGFHEFSGPGRACGPNGVIAITERPPRLLAKLCFRAPMFAIRQSFRRIPHPTSAQQRWIRTLHPRNDSGERRSPLRRRLVFYPAALVVLGIAGAVAYETNQPFRHTLLAAARCSRVASTSILFSCLHVNDVPQMQPSPAQSTTS